MDYSLLLKTQEKLVKLFNNSFKKNRLSQVYLLDGVKGTPKMQAAMYLANMILCDTHDFCEECSNCKRLEENVHPRVFIVSPGGLDNNQNSNNQNNASQTIKVEQIESLENEFNYSGLEKGPRVFIINEIEKATLSAGNKLLKFLEEIKEECYGILITNNLNGVLSTIKSRSQIITLEKMSNEVLKEAFLSKGIDEENSRILCTLTNNVKEGLEILEEGTYTKIVTLVKRLFIALFTSESTVLIMNEEGKFLMTLDKHYHQMFIDLLITFANDYLVNYLLKQDKVVFVNGINELKQMNKDLSSVYDNKKAYELISLLLEYKKRINYNVNLELIYMDMFIKCERLR